MSNDSIEKTISAEVKEVDECEGLVNGEMGFSIEASDINQ